MGKSREGDEAAFGARAWGREPNCGSTSVAPVSLAFIITSGLGILRQETVPPGLRVSFPFPLTCAGAHRPPQLIGPLQGRGMREHGEGAAAEGGCGPFFLHVTCMESCPQLWSPSSSPKLDKRFYREPGAWLHRENWVRKQAEWSCLSSSRSRIELITGKVIVRKPHSLSRTVPISFFLPWCWFKGLPASHSGKGKGASYKAESDRAITWAEETWKGV